MLGNLFLQRKLYALTMVETGYAKVPEQFTRGRNQNIEVIMKAEEAAQAARLRVWEGWTPPVISAAAVDGGDDDEQEFIEVEVSEIVSAGHFFISRKGNANLAWIAEQLAGVEPTPAEENKRNAIRLAKWQGDWYRCKVEKIAKGLANVLFIDYGNRDQVPVEGLCDISPALAELPATASECVLACLKCPEPDADLGEEAAFAFRDLVWQRSLVAEVHGKQHGVMQVLLLDPATEVTVNAALLKQGLARVDTKARKMGPLIKQLLPEEKIGKESRMGVWMYGDPGDSDDEL